jgi:hypothetical protein
MDWMMQGLNPRREKRFFSSPIFPNSLDLLSLLYKRKWWLFPQG